MLQTPQELPLPLVIPVMIEFVKKKQLIYSEKEVKVK